MSHDVIYMKPLLEISPVIPATLHDGKTQGKRRRNHYYKYITTSAYNSCYMKSPNGSQVTIYIATKRLIITLSVRI